MRRAIFPVLLALVTALLLPQTVQAVSCDAANSCPAGQQCVYPNYVTTQGQCQPIASSGCTSDSDCGLGQQCQFDTYVQQSGRCVSTFETADTRAASQNRNSSGSVGPLLEGINCAKTLDQVDNDAQAINCTLCDVLHLLINISRVILGLSGVLALLMFVFGGIYMITAYGQEDRIKRGKDAIVAAITGLIVIAMAWVIINTLILALSGTKINGINALLGNNFNCTPATSGTAADSTPLPANTETGGEVEESLDEDPGGV